MRLRLTLAYDGSHFAGWQSQPGGGTVQDAVEEAFQKLCGVRIPVHGAGRTDAGVHAVGQCAHVDVPEGRLPAAAWLPALNAHLPAPVRIMGLRRVPPDFHARFSATGKIYRYTIWNGPVMPPLLLDRAWHVFQEINLSALSAACRSFEGRHDFSAFSAKRSKAAEDGVRSLKSVRIRKSGALLTLTFEGEGFLYKMVRILAASAVRCATGKLTQADIVARLESGAPRMNHVAPAGGLCLERVRYSGGSKKAG